MKTYRVDLKPISPYFFGNEKTFPYKGQSVGRRLSNSYYIKSERTPSQTTVLGALRYLFLAHRNSNYEYSEKEFSENALRVGGESFDIGRTEEQDFGIIKSVSPVFLYHGEKGILIPTPFDHNVADKTGTYAPFGRYSKTETPDGTKLYTDDYNAKLGLTDSYTALDTRKTVPSEDIFYFEERVGIAIDKSEKAFFKKKYAMLRKGYSFSVYLTVADDGAVSDMKRASGNSVSVFMGQGKSAFAVSFTEEKNTVASKIAPLLKRELPEGVTGEAVYFAGDAIVSDSGKLYEKTLFSVVKTKDYRSFGIAYKDSGENRRKVGQFKKKETLYKLIAAGSFIIAPDADEIIELFANDNAQKIGLNQIVK